MGGGKLLAQGEQNPSWLPPRYGPISRSHSNSLISTPLEEKVCRREMCCIRCQEFLDWPCIQPDWYGWDFPNPQVKMPLLQQHANQAVVLSSWFYFTHPKIKSNKLSGKRCAILPSMALQDTERGFGDKSPMKVCCIMWNTAEICQAMTCCGKSANRRWMR